MRYKIANYKHIPYATVPENQVFSDGWVKEINELWEAWVAAGVVQRDEYADETQERHYDVCAS